MTLLEVGRTLSVKDRRAWRSWLAKNHAKAADVWLVYYKKSSGKGGIGYGEAVEEALCYGWIDSTVKGLDEHRYAQRFTPRRSGSVLSETNRARVRRLEEQGLMTEVGREALRRTRASPKATLQPDVRAALQEDSVVWKNFQAFPKPYRDIRLGWVEMARGRPEEFQKRLRYLVRMTRLNKMYGMVRG